MIDKMEHTIYSSVEHAAWRHVWCKSAKTVLELSIKHIVTMTANDLWGKLEDTFDRSVIPMVNNKTKECLYNITYTKL